MNSTPPALFGLISIVFSGFGSSPRDIASEQTGQDHRDHGNKRTLVVKYTAQIVKSAAEWTFAGPGYDKHSKTAGGNLPADIVDDSIR